MNKLFLLSATALVAVWSFNAKAASSGSATGTATVEVVKDMSITHASSDKLDFGSVYAKASNTVAVTAAASPTRSGDAFGTFTADKFTIAGPEGATFRLDVPASVEMTGPNSATLTATLTPSESGTMTMPAADKLIYVGGSVTAAADTPTGTYTGNYDVTINY